MGAKKPPSRITEKDVRRARAKLILWLSFSLVRYKLLRKIIKKFKEEGIFEKHKLYIRAWLSYLDQKKFSKKVEKQMLGEIKRYLATRDRKVLEHLVEVVWNESGSEAWIVVIEKD